MAYICRVRPWVRIPGGRICCAQKLPNLGGSGVGGPGAVPLHYSHHFWVGPSLDRFSGVKMWPWGIRTSVSPPVADPRKGRRLSQLDHRTGATNTRRFWFGRGYTTRCKKNRFNHGNWQLAFLVWMNNTRYIHFTFGKLTTGIFSQNEQHQIYSLYFFGIWQLAIIFITMNIAKPFTLATDIWQ